MPSEDLLAAKVDAMTKLPINVCRVESSEGAADYVTCLTHERVFERGLPGEAIIGVLLRPLEAGENITPENFARNRLFVDFLHCVVARRGPQLAGVLAEARRQGQGLVVVVDRRTRTPQGPVPPKDIVGVFEVHDGKVVHDSYHPSPKHEILSSDGFFQLDPELQSCLLEELVALTEANPKRDDIARDKPLTSGSS
jgi:hypothetical protein